MNYVKKKFDAKEKNVSNGYHTSNGHHTSTSTLNFNDKLNFKDNNIPNIDDNKAFNKRNTPKNKDKVSVCIVIPTYNEAHNIINLLDIVYAKDQQLKYSKEKIVMNVLVVDDNSPDGTATMVKKYQTTNSNVYLLSRSEKDGLGAAYIAGMQHAMKTLKPDILFEMDGDLSHDPKYILPMIAKIREGADFVIGSRYVKGGSIPNNWGAKRKLISKTANMFAKNILGIKNVNDCTGGFRAIRKSALEKIDLSSLKTKGYAFQISLLEAMRKNDAVIAEIPIAFKDRTRGESKMRVYDMVEEGLFVVKTAFKNQFSSNSRGFIKKQESELVNNSQEKHLIKANSFEKSGMSSSAEGRVF